MPPQVTRIALVFACLISLFLIARSFLVPSTFGEKGHYRLAAVGQIASRSPRYAGNKACVDCHSDLLDTSFHVKKGVHCETCHGPSADHAESFDKFSSIKPKEREFCATCHATNVARRATFPQINLKEHYPDSLCTECHSIHSAEPNVTIDSDTQQGGKGK